MVNELATGIQAKKARREKKPEGRKGRELKFGRDNITVKDSKTGCRRVRKSAVRDSHATLKII